MIVNADIENKLTPDFWSKEYGIPTGKAFAKSIAAKQSRPGSPVPASQPLSQVQSPLSQPTTLVTSQSSVSSAPPTEAKTIAPPVKSSNVKVAPAPAPTYFVPKNYSTPAKLNAPAVCIISTSALESPVVFVQQTKTTAPVNITLNQQVKPSAQITKPFSSVLQYSSPMSKPNVSTSKASTTTLRSIAPAPAPAQFAGSKPATTVHLASVSQSPPLIPHRSAGVPIQYPPQSQTAALTSRQSSVKTTTPKAITNYTRAMSQTPVPSLIPVANVQSITSDEGDCSFQCGECTFMNPDRGMVWDHVETHLVPYMCAWCDRLFRNFMNCLVHVRLEHGDGDGTPVDSPIRVAEQLHRMRLGIKTLVTQKLPFQVIKVQSLASRKLSK